MKLKIVVTIVFIFFATKRSHGEREKTTQQQRATRGILARDHPRAQ